MPVHTPSRTPVRAPSNAAYAAARALSDGQAKPLGALGDLEALAAWVASCQGVCPPRQLEDVRVVVFAGDHGIAADGVSAYPVEITPAMVYGIAGGHAGVSALAAANSVSVSIYDLGVAVDFDDLPPEVSRFKVRRSSGAIHLTDALTRAEVEAALAAGDTIAAEQIADGAQLLISGDLGIGNTTVAAALIAATLGVPGAAVTGRGTGIDEGTLVHKTALIEAAVARAGDRVADPVERLAALGAADFAAAVGFISGAARRGVPVLLDGVIAVAEALVAEDYAPGTKAWLQAGHRSTEPGQALALDRLGLAPLVDFSMRLGEGSGAVLAVPVLRSAVAALTGIAQLSDLT
ncbi:MAG: nicotinate-nucleotide--dimethylbenzimidazole phosphoribosyltransferase [Actinobacteria bacterium HGW-Actinobacteria-5]|jgi:nicotinate-nucleotide--dimethylbenzimidazole phosphoribosyltransferase|nr:MAG: nicotinate-nucleotide--dimethylbenzimidazole phosphoribosyltransferase [Actinobacteria bacterium HGW-Actinobacteria-5]